jgi:DNA polymerase-4
LDELAAELKPILDKVWHYCEQTGTRGRTVTLKVKFHDFQQITRSRSLAGTVESRATLEKPALDLLSELFPLGKPVRLIGVTLSSLASGKAPEVPQLSLSLAP